MAFQARMTDQPVADFVRSQVPNSRYGQKFRYAIFRTTRASVLTRRRFARLTPLVRRRTATRNLRIFAVCPTVLATEESMRR